MLQRYITKESSYAEEREYPDTPRGSLSLPSDSCDFEMKDLARMVMDKEDRSDVNIFNESYDKMLEDLS